MMKLHSQEMNAKKTVFYKMGNFVESPDETAKYTLEPSKTVYPGPPSRAS